MSARSVTGSFTRKWSRSSRRKRRYKLILRPRQLRQWFQTMCRRGSGRAQERVHAAEWCNGHNKLSSQTNFAIFDQDALILPKYAELMKFICNMAMPTMRNNSQWCHFPSNSPLGSSCSNPWTAMINPPMKKYLSGQVSSSDDCNLSGQEKKS